MVHVSRLQALTVLGLETEPVIPLLDMGGWRCPPGEWIDYAVMEHLTDFLEGAYVSEMADQIGVRGQRVAGRCKALANRGLLAQVRGKALANLDATVYEVKPSGNAWRLSAKALDKLGVPQEIRRVLRAAAQEGA